MTNYCFTLGYNLVSEIEKTTRLLYQLNDSRDFRHLIVDLGFPLEHGGIVPDNIDEAKERNSEKLKKLAAAFGSEYVKMSNIGVSQNWTQVYEYLKPSDDDILIGTDPDEHPLNAGWVKAIGDVIREGNFGLVSLMMTSHIQLLSSVPRNERFYGNRRVYLFPAGALNWALIGVSGKFFNIIKEMPFPTEAPRYGWIEGSLYPLFARHGFGWCVLADYQVRHTDFELGDQGTSSLLREWKNQIIFNIHQYGQLSFDEWLEMRREGRI